MQSQKWLGDVFSSGKCWCFYIPAPFGEHMGSLIHTPIIPDSWPVVSQWLIPYTLWQTNIAIA